MRGHLKRPVVGPVVGMSRAVRQAGSPVSYRIIRDDIHSQIFSTDEDPHRDDNVFETFRGAKARLLQYLEDRRKTIEMVIDRIKGTTELDLYGE